MLLIKWYNHKYIYNKPDFIRLSGNMIMYLYYGIHLYSLHLGKKKDKIRNLSNNKSHKKSYLVVKNLSTATPITCYGGTSITKPGLVTKKRELPRTFYIFLTLTTLCIFCLAWYSKMR